MARKTNDRSNRSQTSIAQIKALIADGGNRANEVRGDGLRELVKIKRVKVVNTRRERVRVEAKNGAGDPRIKRLDEQIVFEHRQLTAARAESDRVAAPTEAPDRNAWVLHGYVRDEDGFGQTGYTVALFPDEYGQEEPVLSIPTGKRGYYRYQPDSRQRGVELADNVSGAETPIRTNVPHTKARALYIGVRDPNGNLLTVEPRPVYPRRGTMAYRDIVVQAPDTGRAGKRLPTRFLGNSSSRELHDLDNEKKSCHIARIRPDNRYYFRNTLLAEELGFGYCGHCFGKTRANQ